jgi:hypothetical protein
MPPFSVSFAIVFACPFLVSLDSHLPLYVHLISSVRNYFSTTQKVNVPRASDDTYLSKIQQAHAKHANFVRTPASKLKIPNERQCFGVVHYACVFSILGGGAFLDWF